MLKKMALILIILVNTTAWSLNEVMGIPTMQIEHHFGDNKIGNILVKTEVWTGVHSAIYIDDNTYIKKKDDKIYNMLLNIINSHKRKNKNIVDVLTNENVGVICKKTVCKYHGYFITTLKNAPKHHFPNGVQVSRYDIYINFSPENLEETYSSMIKSKTINGGLTTTK